MHEEFVAKIQEIQKDKFGIFELVFKEKLKNVDSFIEDITEGEYYWMNEVEKYRYHGVEIDSFDVMYLLIADDLEACFITLPRTSDPEILIRFAERYKADVYFDGELLYEVKVE